MAAPGMIGQHVASLNLFLEADGALYVTVAGGDFNVIRKLKIERELPETEVPADTVLRLLAMAKNIEGLAG